MNRREFTKMAAVFPLAAVSKSFASTQAVLADRGGVDTDRLQVHLFSKHLQFLNYTEMAEAAAEIGCDGLDLTVRKGGHVLPERSVDDLPLAVDAIRAVGLRTEMFVSHVNGVSDTIGLKALSVAAELGFRSYRMTYYDFDKSLDWRGNLDRCRAEVQALAVFNQEHCLHGAYQNHSGSHVGSYVTDIAYILKGLDLDWSGCQYDIRHAVMEGGRAWETGLWSVKDNIRTIALKDFVWAKVSGKWTFVNVPLGEGMVDFLAYFKLLRLYGIHPTVSLHAEYDLGGAEKGRREITMARDDIFSALKRDLQFVHEMWARSAE